MKMSQRNKTEARKYKEVQKSCKFVTEHYNYDALSTSNIYQQNGLTGPLHIED